ncbi:MAG: NGG1p interacting factor NIF3 [Endomicrobia bacterium]|nr:NGG1p interacting factor NIF3 [Endomicrobiia bacterium]MCX7941240.1 NGG1p interacting factor NIF3 [Endomicrobiia bacterium]MDW8056066.1 NGG1p interacting factor NIF3 [Elusimicrobiota bacterium]
MKLKEFYNFIVEHGIKNDPRGEKVVKELLKREKQKFDEMPEKEKKYYDKEKLSNPYNDTRILVGEDNVEIKSILVGIDMEMPEVLLAQILRQQGNTVDLILSHHPEGVGYKNFYEVMNMQADILAKFGVPINVAEGILEPRIKEVHRKLMPMNHNRAVDIANLLGIPFICCHTPADNCVATYLQKLFDDEKPRYIKDVIDILLEIPEYDHAAKLGYGPHILTGNKDRKAGKIFVDMTGGTEGSTEVFEKLAVAGVSTVVAMHLSEDHFKNAQKFHINVVIAGHIASDNLGLNLILDATEKKFGKLNITCVSGFKRFKHIK